MVRARKTARQLLGLLAGVVLVVAGFVLPSSSAVASTSETAVSFVDVPASYPFSREISWLAAQGISTGWVTAAGREYRPQAPIGRDAMAAFLYRAAGSPTFTPPAASPFVDVPTGYPFYREITWLAAQKISTGWSTSAGAEFRPAQSITRDAMAAFLYRYAKSPAFTVPAVSPFIDVTASSSGFYREITWLASTGVTTGWTTAAGAEYRPYAPIARDAMAAFLYRYEATTVPVDASNPSAGTVTVAPDTKVLDQTVLATGTQTASQLTLPEAVSTSIHPGDVLTAGVTPVTPEGMLVRVATVTRTPGSDTVVQTTPATLRDAIVTTNGPVQAAGVPVSSSFTPDADVTDTTGTTAAPVVAIAPAPTPTTIPAGITRKTAPDTATATAVADTTSTTAAVTAGVDLFSTSFRWLRKFSASASVPSSVLSGKGSATIESNATVSARATMSLDMGFLSVNETSVIVTPKTIMRNKLTMSQDLKGTLRATLGKLEPTFTFTIGPVPVVVTTSFKISGAVAVDGSAEISYETASTISSDHGFEYKNGSFSLINTTPRLSGQSNTVQASASLTAKASLDFDVAAKLYGVAGITLGFGPYVQATITVTSANGTTSWTCPGEFGLAGRIGVTAGIEVLGIKLTDWTQVASHDWPLFTVDPCKGTPVVPPTPGPTPSPSPTPTPTSTPTSSVQSIAGGANFGYALKTDGTVWAWGNNGYGELGNGTTIYSSTPVQVQDLTSVRSIAGGYETGYALKTDGTVWAWGYNGNGQLGNGTTTDSSTPVQVQGLTGVQTIAAGLETGYALKSDGTVWAWGSNGSWQLGTGDASTTSYRLTPAQVLGLTGVKAIAAGWYAGYALKADGTVWAWGSNNEGQLGNGITTGYSITRVQVQGLTSVQTIIAGCYTGYALKTDGTVWAWGSNNEGQLGNGITTNSITPVQTQGLTSVQTIAAGCYTGYALKTDGTVWAWGSNEGGQLGNGTTTNSITPVQTQGLTSVQTIAASRYTGYALKTDGTVWAWGANYDGQLGNGTTTDSSVPVQVRL